MNLTGLAWRTQPSTSPNLLGLHPAAIRRTLEDLSAIGNRFHGTDGEGLALTYLFDRLAEIGCDEVRREPFRYVAYRPGAVGFSVDGISVPCTGLQYSATGCVSAPVRYVGAPHSVADLDELRDQGLDVDGCIVLLDTLYVGALSPWLITHGAVGVAVISPTPDGLVGNFIGCAAPPPLTPPWTDRPGAIPGVTIEREHGRRLAARVANASDVRAELVHESTYEEIDGYNVVGDLHGTRRGHVVVGCHSDSQRVGPCVWDNGSGIAGALEIGRVLAADRDRAGVRIVAFGAEETGLWGSAQYVAAHEHELDDVLAMVNIDGAGSRYPSRHTAIVSSAIRERAAAVAGRCEWPIDDLLDADDHPHVDSWSFARRGVPSAIFLEYPPLHPYYHTEGDVLELLDPVRLASTAGVAGALVREVCGGAEA